MYCNWNKINLNTVPNGAYNFGAQTSNTKIFERALYSVISSLTFFAFKERTTKEIV